MWRVLTNEHRFGLFFVGCVVANIGYWSQVVAAILLIYRLTGSVLLVGIVSAVQFVWPIILGPWVGNLTDRLDRRLLFAGTMLVGALVSVFLAVVTALDVVTVSSVLAAVAVFGIGMAFLGPVQISLVPLLVASRDHEFGLALNSSAYNLARVLGPVAGSGLILISDIALVFVFNAIAYALGIVVLPFIRPRAQDVPKDAPRYWETVALVKHNPAILPLFAIGFVTSGSTEVITTLGPAVSTDLTGTEEWTGLFVAALGAGAVVSAFWLVAFLQRLRRRLPLALGVQALGAALFAFAPAPWVALLGAFLMGVGFIPAANRALSIVHRLVDPEMLGRITALWLMGFVGGRGVYALACGVIADSFSSLAAGVIVAVSIAVTAVLSHFLGRERRTA